MTWSFTVYFHGFTKNFEQAEGNEPYDMVIYGLFPWLHKELRTG